MARSSLPATSRSIETCRMQSGTTQAAKSEPQADAPLPIRRLQTEGSVSRCITDREDVLVPRAAARYLHPGDRVRVKCFGTPVSEYLAIQDSGRRKSSHLYFGRIGYVTRPKPDRRNEHYVRAEVSESRLGIRSLHVPNSAVRDYFYDFAHGQSGPRNLYDLLRTTPAASPADLRLAYRVRRLEIETANAGKEEM